MIQSLLFIIHSSEGPKGTQKNGVKSATNRPRKTVKSAGGVGVTHMGLSRVLDVGGVIVDPQARVLPSHLTSARARLA